MNRLIAALALVASLLDFDPARAGTDEDLRALYARFYTAQNARDVARVRETLLDSERFLWVSNGQSFRGRETMLARMVEFQQAEIWEVTPELERAEVVELGADAAYLHLPLALAFGSRQPGPALYHFLVTVLCVRTEAGWRIAGLLTTRESAD